MVAWCPKILPFRFVSPLAALLPVAAGLVLAIALLVAGCSPPANETGSNNTGASETDGTAAAATAAASPESSRSAVSADADFVGSQACGACHARQLADWQGSHHQQAMEVADSNTVLGDFAAGTHTVAGIESKFTQSAGDYTISTDGAGGGIERFSVRYVFGVEPLQQYLLPLEGGRLQAAALAWDARAAEAGGQRWFHLREDASGKPDDVLHWTAGAFNWNSNCADCHSTFVEKNYSATSRSYDTKFAEVSVGCEACHGAGSIHAADPVRALPAMSGQAMQINTCAQCHSRRSQLADGFTPARSCFVHYLPSLLDDGLYHADGQILDEVYVYGSFLQSKMHQQGVTCSNCHDSHTAKLRLSGNAVCTQCHNATGRPDFPSLPLANFESPEHHFHPLESEGTRCVSCHMTSKTYMQVDDRRDHSFRVPRPDLSVSSGAPNACTQCHSDQTPQWAMAQLAARQPEADLAGDGSRHYGFLLAGARSGDPDVEQELGALGNNLEKPGIVRGTALSLMSGYGRGFTASAVEQGLRDDDPLVRIGAVRGAQRWDGPARWQRLRPLLRDSQRAVRVEVMRVLLDVFPALPAPAQSALRKNLDEYRQVLLFNADQPEAQSGLAALSAIAGDMAGAESALREALTLNPQWVPALVNLADLYRQLGRDAEGGPLLARATELVAEQPDVLLARGLWLVRQQRSTQGLPLLQRAFAHGGRQVRYGYVYAIALHSLGQSTQAIRVLMQLQEFAPSDPQVQQALRSITREAAARG